MTTENLMDLTLKSVLIWIQSVWLWMICFFNQSIIFQSCRNGPISLRLKCLVPLLISCWHWSCPSLAIIRQANQFVLQNLFLIYHIQKSWVKACLDGMILSAWQNHTWFCHVWFLCLDGITMSCVISFNSGETGWAPWAISSCSTSFHCYS